jgi:octopine/nopaline transport system substrate-binding protein
MKDIGRIRECRKSSERDIDLMMGNMHVSFGDVSRHSFVLQQPEKSLLALAKPQIG